MYSVAYQKFNLFWFFSKARQKKRIERFRSIVKFTFIKIKVKYLTWHYLKILKFHWQQVQEEGGGFIWSKEMFLTNIFLQNPWV